MRSSVAGREKKSLQSDTVKEINCCEYSFKVLLTFGATCAKECGYN